MNTKKLLAISVLIGFTISFVISFLLGLDKVFSAIAGADYTFLVLAFAFQMLSLFTLFLRWERIVDYAKIRFSYSRLFLASLAGSALTNLTPSSRMGGEPFRIYFLRKFSSAKTALSLATVVAERVFDAAVFGFLSLFTLVFALFYWDLPLWTILFLFLSFIVCLSMLLFALYLSFNKKVGLKFALLIISKFRFVLKYFISTDKLKKKITGNVARYNKSLIMLLASKKLWFYGLFYSCIIWSFDVFRTYFLFRALNFNASFIVIACVLIISALAGAIPLFPGGLVLIETVMILIYSTSGIPLLTAGIVTVIDRLISFWAVTFIGLAASYYLGFTEASRVRTKRTRQ